MIKTQCYVKDPTELSQKYSAKSIKNEAISNQLIDLFFSRPQRGRGGKRKNRQWQKSKLYCYYHFIKQTPISGLKE